MITNQDLLEYSVLESVLNPLIKSKKVLSVKEMDEVFESLITEAKAKKLNPKLLNKGYAKHINTLTKKVTQDFVYDFYFLNHQPALTSKKSATPEPISESATTEFPYSITFTYGDGGFVCEEFGMIPEEIDDPTPSAALLRAIDERDIFDSDWEMEEDDIIDGVRIWTQDGTVKFIAEVETDVDGNSYTISRSIDSYLNYREGDEHIDKGSIECKDLEECLVELEKWKNAVNKAIGQINVSRNKNLEDINLNEETEEEKAARFDKENKQIQSEIRKPGYSMPKQSAATRDPKDGRNVSEGYRPSDEELDKRATQIISVLSDGLLKDLEEATGYDFWKEDSPFFVHDSLNKNDTGYAYHSICKKMEIPNSSNSLYWSLDWNFNKDWNFEYDVYLSIVDENANGIPADNATVVKHLKEGSYEYTIDDDESNHCAYFPKTYDSKVIEMFAGFLKNADADMQTYLEGPIEDLETKDSGDDREVSEDTPRFKVGGAEEDEYEKEWRDAVMAGTFFGSLEEYIQQEEKRYWEEGKADIEIDRIRSGEIAEDTDIPYDPEEEDTFV